MPELDRQRWEKFKQSFGSDSNIHHIKRLNVQVKYRSLTVGQMEDLRAINDITRKQIATIEFAVVEPYGLPLKALIQNMTLEEIKQVCDQIMKFSQDEEEKDEQQYKEEMQILIAIIQDTHWSFGEIFELPFEDLMRLYNMVVERDKLLRELKKKYGYKLPQEWWEGWQNWLAENTNYLDAIREHGNKRRKKQLKQDKDT